MTIRNRLSYLFTGIVAAAMLVFSVVIYLLQERYRQIEFDGRLKEKAISTAEFVTHMDDLNPKYLKSFSQKSSEFLEDESVIVFDQTDPKHPIIFTSGIMNVPALYQYFYDIKTQKERHVALDDDSEMYGVLFTDLERDFVVVAKAFDHYGMTKMESLRKNLALAWLASVLIVFFISRYYSHRALKPINNIINQVQNIGYNNLNARVMGSNEEDEISHLAATFNGMLDRLKMAIDTQKSFVSNASHELRTPLTAMYGQIEVAMLKKRTAQEYETTLTSIKEDIIEMKDLSNSLLDLASMESGLTATSKESLRFDEIIWEAQDEIMQKRTNAQINVDFIEIPDEDESFLIMGNEHLLKTAILNLIDNAVKFSDNGKANVSLLFTPKTIEINVQNTGKPIAPDDLTNLFVPFFRSENTKKIKGHGIGLALTKKIVELHQGQIKVKSSVEAGTIFTIQFVR